MSRDEQGLTGVPEVILGTARHADSVCSRYHCRFNQGLTSSALEDGDCGHERRSEHQRGGEGDRSDDPYPALLRTHRPADAGQPRLGWSASICRTRSGMDCLSATFAQHGHVDWRDVPLRRVATRRGFDLAGQASLVAETLGPGAAGNGCT